MTIHVVVFILLVHFVADFICQPRWMGEGKSKSFKILLLHVLTYTVVSFFILTLFFEIFAPQYRNLSLTYYVLVNGGLHLVVDFFTSKGTAYFHQKKKMGFFWWTIGFDQFSHSVCLLETLKILI